MNFLHLSRKNEKYIGAHARKSIFIITESMFIFLSTFSLIRATAFTFYEKSIINFCLAERFRRKTRHGICKQMNEGKDYGVWESEATSAHLREAKARTRD